MMNRLQTRWKSGIARITALAAAVLLTVVTCLTVTAAEVSGTGTLTILPKTGNAVLNATAYDGTFTVYRVADYATTGVYTNAAGFESYSAYSINGSTLSDENANKVLAQSLAAFAAEHKDSITPPVTNAVAGDVYTLSYGVYLIQQAQSATGYSDCIPFLIMIPQYGENAMETDITAYPKVEKELTPGGGEHHDSNPPTTPAKYGKAALGKSDAETGLPLQGVVFNLSKYIDKEWVVIGTYTTDENGVIYVDKLSYGSYRFVETQTLEGYILDATPQEFRINSEDTVQLTMTNAPIPAVPEPAEPTIRTGDGSNMMLYGAIAAAAVVMLLIWIVRNKRSSDSDADQ